MPVVVLGVTGCIGAYKACEVVRGLDRAGCAVLVEVAVRNPILQLRGFNSAEEFAERQRAAIAADEQGD